MRPGSIPHEADDHFRLGVLDPTGQLLRRKAAEDDGVHGADARTREHRNHRLRDHRHVDDHAVAAPDPLRRQRPRSRRRDRAARDRWGLRRLGDRRVVDQGELAATALDVPVERVVTGVEAAAAGTSGRRRACRRARAPRLVPVDRLGGLGPELLRLLERRRYTSSNRDIPALEATPPLVTGQTTRSGRGQRASRGCSRTACALGRDGQVVGVDVLVAVSGVVRGWAGRRVEVAR